MKNLKIDQARKVRAYLEAHKGEFVDWVAFDRADERDRLRRTQSWQSPSIVRYGPEMERERGAALDEVDDILERLGGDRVEAIDED